ncbi:hypothetical protein EDL79_04115 [Ehrlichia ruminantium]|uniref:Uncharacterized protein n=1 Tax=Ehrlichia ruminantium TaxID=779 RepID=A0AAE6Q9E7_EHRRU|nr:hypothetical protein [Ehrlichia ruminantium]QGR02798.1 hypothetical protein EDL81_04095 [Ehrlichia ruminantium]QGR03722.1 hypothetical protein EDL80_04105 [Ehrlichia ruminantium]QGR04649.1 hypothetical protein EDL79_04115 [Ehrlichia ruminantium]
MIKEVLGFLYLVVEAVTNFAVNTRARVNSIDVRANATELMNGVANELQNVTGVLTNSSLTYNATDVNGILQNTTVTPNSPVAYNATGVGDILQSTTMIPNSSLYHVTSVNNVVDHSSSYVQYYILCFVGFVVIFLACLIRLCVSNGLCSRINRTGRVSSGYIYDEPDSGCGTSIESNMNSMENEDYVFVYNPEYMNSNNMDEGDNSFSMEFAFQGINCEPFDDISTAETVCSADFRYSSESDENNSDEEFDKQGEDAEGMLQSVRVVSSTSINETRL